MQQYCSINSEGKTKFLPDRYVEGECPVCHEDDASGDDDCEDDDVEDLRDKIDADVELAFALRNEVVPHAILWFTGEAVDDDDEDFDDVEVSDDEED